MDLEEAVTDLTRLLSPKRVKAIASAFRGIGRRHELINPDGLANTAPAKEAIATVVSAWQRTSVSGDEVAGMLSGAAAARARAAVELSVELVWTGPTTRYVATRRTEQVLLDLIRHAQKDVILISFVAYDIPGVASALNEAIHRGVRVRALVEASSAHGGTLNVDPAAHMRAAVRGVELYTWLNRTGRFAGGKVHAKIAVTDGSRAFVTSANLTGHAMDKNMEAGVLIHGSDVPSTLRDHFDALVDVGVLSLV